MLMTSLLSNWLHSLIRDKQIQTVRSCRSTSAILYILFIGWSCNVLEYQRGADTCEVVPSKKPSFLYFIYLSIWKYLFNTINYFYNKFVVKNRGIISKTKPTCVGKYCIIWITCIFLPVRCLSKQNSIRLFVNKCSAEDALRKRCRITWGANNKGAIAWSLLNIFINLVQLFICHYCFEYMSCFSSLFTNYYFK